MPQRMTPEQHVALLQQSDRPLQSGGAGAYQAATHALDMPGKALTGLAVRSGITNPYAAAAIGVLPDLAEDYLFGGKGQVGTATGIVKKNIAGPTAAVTASPYEAISQAEQARIAAVHQRGAQLGLTLPEAGASSHEFTEAAKANVPAAETGIRRQLNLPDDAPLSKPFFKEMRKQLGNEGAYGKVRSLDSLSIDDAQDDLTALPKPVQERLGLNNKISADNTISGDNAMKLWSDLKDRASDKWDAYGDSSLTEHADAARDLDRAADSVHSAIIGHLNANGMSDVASQLDQDAKTFAQTYSTEAALKGKRLDVSKLVRQYSAGAPMEGDMAVIAELGEQHPEAFRLSRIGTYEPGLIKRTAAAVIPKIATAGGAALGTPLGPLGIGGAALGGNMLGEHIASRILRP